MVIEMLEHGERGEFVLRDQLSPDTAAGERTYKLCIKDGVETVLTYLVVVSRAAAGEGRFGRFEHPSCWCCSA